MFPVYLSNTLYCTETIVSTENTKKTYVIRLTVPEMQNLEKSIIV